MLSVRERTAIRAPTRRRCNAANLCGSSDRRALSRFFAEACPADPSATHHPQRVRSSWRINSSRLPRTARRTAPKLAAVSASVTTAAYAPSGSTLTKASSNSNIAATVGPWPRIRAQRLRRAQRARPHRPQRLQKPHLTAPRRLDGKAIPPHQHRRPHAGDAQKAAQHVTDIRHSAPLLNPYASPAASRRCIAASHSHHSTPAQRHLSTAKRIIETNKSAIAECGSSSARGVTEAYVQPTKCGNARRRTGVVRS